MKIFFISAGRVGQSLGKLLLKKGHQGVGVWSRSEVSAHRNALFLGVGAYWGQPFPENLQQAEVVLLSPPERYVRPLGQAISGFLAKGAVVLHTAGSLPPLEISGVHCGVLHPLQSIASPEAGLTVIPGSFMGISGDEAALIVAEQLAKDAGGKPVAVKDPVLYHLAAVMASNTLYPLFAAACDLLVKAGVAAETAPSMLLPLVRGSVENIARLGPAKGMTGPIARADAETIGRHLAALEDDATVKAMYVSLARRALSLAEEAGAEPRGLQAIEALLEE